MSNSSNITLYTEPIQICGHTRGLGKRSKIFCERPQGHEQGFHAGRGAVDQWFAWDNDRRKTRAVFPFELAEEFEGQYRSTWVNNYSTTIPNSSTVQFSLDSTGYAYLTGAVLNPSSAFTITNVT